MYFNHLRNLSLKLTVIAAVGTALWAAPADAQQIVRVPGDKATLQEALDAVPNGGIIEMAAGTYTAPANAFTIFPDLAGNTKSFTVRAASGAKVQLTGGSGRGLFTLTTPNLIKFENLDFVNAKASENHFGSVISMQRAQVIFSGCTFQNNSSTAPSSGGGVRIDNSVASFENCSFTNNTATSFGAAIIADKSRVFIRDSQFVGNRIDVANHVQFSAGGAIHANASALQISRTRFENNRAAYVGGAIYAYAPWQDPITTPVMLLTVNDCVFEGNTAAKLPGDSFAAEETGGAVMLEDQTHGRFLNCRFLNNSAKQGGAISSYRTTTEIGNSVFRSNRSFGTGASESFGGAIFVLSDDNADGSTENGTKNRPSARLSVTDSLIQGPGGGVISGRQGGGIFIAGDLHSAYGVGVRQSGTIESNRATLNLKRVVFADLATSDAGLATGGAMTADFVDLTIEDSMVQNCSATQNGGGIQVISNSVATIKNTTFAGNSAGVLGGAFNMFGGQLNMSGCKFLGNRITVAGGGAAIMSGAAPADPGRGLPAADLNGALEDCVFSDNTGATTKQVSIYDGNSFATGPYNRLQYNRSQFAEDAEPFFSDNIGYLDIDRLNALTIPRLGGPATDKVTVPNTALSSAPVTGSVLMIPTSILQSGAPGESVPMQSAVAYTSSGGSATVNGAAQRTARGILDTSRDGAQTLAIGNSSFATVPPAGAAVNISTRLPAGSGDNSLIAGVIVQGTAAKRVIVRAVGPSLGAAGVRGVLQDPTLELFDARGASVAKNNNWQTTEGRASQAVDIQGSAVAPSNALEPAIIATLEPNVPYTAVVGSADGGTGIAVVEVYDLEGVQASKLANISTRGFIQTGDNVMIGGFIYSGGVGATNVVVRAIGPSLAAAGVANALSDPTLEIYNGSGQKVGENDNWGSSQEANALQRTGLHPSHNAESAMLMTGLPHGAYTAVLRGSGSTEGTGLIEVYVFQ